MTRPVSIRFNLLTYFFLVVGIVAISIISLQYYFSLKLARSAAEESFNHVADKTTIYIREKGEQLKTMLRLSSELDDIVKGNLLDPQPEALSLLSGILERAPNLYSTYIGLNNADFYQLINLNLDPSIRERYQAPPQARWLQVRITGIAEQRSKHLDFLDSTFERLESRSESSDYDPRKRPWFLMANYSQDVITTELYWFSGMDSSGITFASQLGSNSGVIGIDLALGSLKQFLVAHKPEMVEETFLFDRYGHKYVSSHSVHAYTSSPIKPSSGSSIAFTDEEQAYLDSNPLITVSNETDWPPMDFTVGGHAEGHNVDLVRLIGEKTGIRFSFINGFSWEELVQLFREKKIDMLQSAYWTEERSRFGRYSVPISSLKNYLITRTGQSLPDINSLSGKSIALVKGWSTVNFVQKNHPDIQIELFPNLVEALIAVEEGRIEATIATEPAYHYNKKLFDLKNLKKGAWIEDFDEGDSRKLHIITQLDNPLLSSIIDKVIKQISEEEKSQLAEKWLSEQASERDKPDTPVALLISSVRNQYELIRFWENGEEYFGFTYPLEGAISDGHQIGMKAKVSTMIAPFMKQVTFSIYVALAVVGLSMLLVLFATSRILRPINQLMIENQKVAERRYKHVQPINSHIREFISLSDSLIDMSESIQTYEKQQEELMDSFIRLIAEAIDTKSPYTGGHCERVPDIAIELARVASDSQSGPFADFKLTSEDEWREFQIGAWLHDCGKVTTPEYVVDKATKLETISNRIHEIRTRFEVLWRDVTIVAHERIMQGDDSDEVSAWVQQEHQQLQDDYEFIAECNIGGEFMSDEKIERLQTIGSRIWLRHFSDRKGLSMTELELYENAPEVQLPAVETLLSNRPEHIVPRKNFDEADYKSRGFKLDVPQHLYNRGELYNLSIKRGTLTEEERFKINDHVIQTIRMLENLPLPDHLKRITEYAGTHHETLIGTGYPRKLTKNELSVPARIMALADIFEALTASDRPYKKAKTLSEAIKIMSFMVKDQHIDAELFALFLRSGVYRKYAEEALLPEQLDEVDIEAVIKQCALAGLN